MEKIATLEKKMGRSVNDYLGFENVAVTPLKCMNYPFGAIKATIGEHCLDDKLTGRGIHFHPDGTIRIGYFIYG